MSDQVKIGVWGGKRQRKSGLSALPKDVQVHCENIRFDADVDWTMFRSTDGQMWVVAKHYEDENHFSVVASVVQYESEEY